MFEVPEAYRIKVGPMASNSSYGNNGCFLVPNKPDLFCIASDGGGWEHVSVSLIKQKRTPTWDEMCAIKDLFWGPEDVVVQYHPRRSEYVNLHPYCLHLWRQVGTAVETPPKFMVG